MLVGLRSRRQIAPFDMHQPATVQQALALHQSPGRSVFMAGGTDLIDWLKYGHTIEHLIRLDGIPELAAIGTGPNGVRIGATATHATLIDSQTIRAELPDFAALWPQVANPRVRFTGTIGGNVMARRSEYDGMPALMALGAQAERATASGVATGPLDPLEALVTAFLVPAPRNHRLFCDRSLRPALSVWLGMTVTDGLVSTLRVAIGAAHPQPVCVTLQPDAPLTSLPAHAGALAAQVIQRLPEPASDVRASASYRRRMIEVLTRRILIRAGGTA